MRMSSFATWVKGLRRHMRLKQAEFANRTGVEQATVSRWENGAEPEFENRSQLNALAQEADYPAFDSLRVATLPVKGYVGAGAEVILFEDHPDHSNFDDIEAPPGITDGIALIVRGDSMYPKYEDGEVIVVSKREYPLDSLLHEICYVQLADGRAYLKILGRGSEKGFYTLRSHNAPDITDVVVDWAFPVEWVRPRRRSARL